MKISSVVSEQNSPSNFRNHRFIYIHFEVLIITAIRICAGLIINHETFKNASIIEHVNRIEIPTTIS